jgi:hypothetical protein
MEVGPRASGGLQSMQGRCIRRALYYRTSPVICDNHCQSARVDTAKVASSHRCLVGFITRAFDRILVGLSIATLGLLVRTGDPHLGKSIRAMD